ncbi:MAG: hypothetical protein ACE5F9_13165 [Phycisphaerae bacterium]
MLHTRPVGYLLAFLSVGAMTATSVAQTRGREPARSEAPRTAWAERPLSLAYQDDGGATAESVETTTETSVETPEPLLWDGFLWGDRHFRKKPRPIGSPLYFEDPFINSDIRAIYLWHKFPDGSALHGGDLSVWALQVRLALTDRLQFLATGDGYSKLSTPILKDDEGWNDLAFALKYALLVDHESDFILSTGLRWRLSNGHANTLNGNVDELSPFVTAYKGFGKLGVMADVVGRIPMDQDDGNNIVSWDVHVDYELVDDFFPLLEIHGLHYLSDGDRLPLDVGGLDYANIGSNDVKGESAYWGTLGFRWNITDQVSWSAGYGFPLQNPDNNDIFEQRATTQIAITF